MVRFDAPKLIGPVPQAGRMVETIEARGKHLEGDLPVGLLADILLNSLPLDAERTAQIFTERCPIARAHHALAWHGESRLEQEE